MHGARAALPHELREVGGDALLVLEDDLCPWWPRSSNVILHALVEVARDLQSFADDVGVELDAREDRRVRVEEDRGARATRRADLLDRPLRFALAVPLLPLEAVTLHRRDEFLRQRVDDAGADTVQAAGRLVVAFLELPARVQHGEDHLERALLRLRVHVHRDAAAIVGDRDRRAVVVQRDGDVRGVPVHRLVDRVVEDLPDEVVQPGGADAADVHARSLADRVEAFEDGDVFGGVRGAAHETRIPTCPVVTLSGWPSTGPQESGLGDRGGPQGF